MSEWLHDKGFEVGISLLLALIPVFIWMTFFLKTNRDCAKTLIKVFLFGAVAVVPILLLQYMWLLYPQFDIYERIIQTESRFNLGFLATFTAIGVFQEMTKFDMLRRLSWINVKIETINEAIRYSLVVALGFAFTENLLTFSDVLASEQLGKLFYELSFRSIFTGAAQMVFSGILAYYYAIGKFGNPVLELDRWTGRRHRLFEWVQRYSGIKQKNVFQFQQSMEGLLIAMVLHAFFNFSLQMGHWDYAAGLVVCGFVFILFLSKKRTNYLVFTSKEKARPSQIGKAEENVVIELMGMWFNEGKFNEVIEICDRLMQRDPDNKVVKLFRAKAVDRKKIERVKKAIHLLFSEEDYDMEQEELSLFERFKRAQAKKKEVKA